MYVMEINEKEANEMVSTLSQWADELEKAQNQKIKYSLEQFEYDIEQAIGVDFYLPYFSSGDPKSILDTLVALKVLNEADIVSFNKKIKKKYVRKDKRNEYANYLINKMTSQKEKVVLYFESLNKIFESDE